MRHSAGQMNKQHILDEIRRTAAANGGVALGVAAFRTATGIKQADWYGIHWARWGDAVREAGLTPKEFVTAFDPDATLALLVALIRELGRFPNQGELRMRKRADPAFPNDKVFTNKFGVKSQLVARTLDYCERHPGWEDVEEICRDDLAQRPDVGAEDAGNNELHEDAEFGFVYLIKLGRYYKIGRSNAVGRRDREIVLQLPEKADTVHVIRTDDPPGIEAYWHQRFAARRKNGEWFGLTAADVRAFKRRKFM
jgi:hypothetical protein